jgi:hypothetical protein
VPQDTPPLFAELEERIASVDPNGRFTFPFVPPGDYTLTTWHIPRRPDSVTLSSSLVMDGRSGPGPEGGPLPPLPDTPTLVASVPISVEKPLADLVVPLRLAARFRGRVVFDGSAGTPPADILAATPLRATDAHGRTMNVPVTGIAADGRFETVGLPPGEYLLEVAPEYSGGRWSSFFTQPMAMASLRTGGVERIGLGLVLDASDVNDVVMTLTDRRWTLSGLVRDADGRSAETGWAVMFPRDRHRWRDVGFGAPHRLDLAAVNRNGRFQLEGPIPGDYLVAAVANPPELWRAPEYLETLVPIATPVRLELGETRSVDLQLR